jgi:hypothetical protein
MAVVLEVGARVRTGLLLDIYIEKNRRFARVDFGSPHRPMILT